MRNILAELLLVSETERELLLSEASVIFKSILATSHSGIHVTFSTDEKTQEQLTCSGTKQDNDGHPGSSPLQSSDLSDGLAAHTEKAPDDSDGHTGGDDGRGAAHDRDAGRGGDADTMGLQRPGRAARGQAQRVDGPNALE